MKPLMNSLVGLLYLVLLMASLTANAAETRASLPSSSVGLARFLHKPKLVLVLVVDQFRADYLTRFHSRFLPVVAKGGELGGYLYLMDRGAYFPFAEYDILQSMTCPGHATILSGSYPYQMGIPLNKWYSPEEQGPVTCVQDKTKPIIGGAEESGGVSPRNFTGDTVGDELKNAGFPSKVVALALKDRSAIMLGGHRADQAIWFDSKRLSWVSSQFYFPDKKLPAWVDKLNQELAPQKDKTFTWKPDPSTGRPTGLTFGAKEGFSHEFRLGSRDAMASPLGIRFTVDAAERALVGEKLGQGPATDILALSFSAHDYLGHQYGPNTLEMEEITVEEDRQISRLLNTVRKQVPGGLKNVTIVLTADHGMPPSPSWLSTVRMNAGKLNPDETVEALNEILDRKFGKLSRGKWIVYQVDANFYINPAGPAEKKVDSEAVENVIREELKKHPSLVYVFTKADYLRRNLPPGMFTRQILKTYIPGKSGDVVGILRPFHMTEEDAVNHMTDYVYDRTVPLVIAGEKVRPGVYSTKAEVVDLAPTLSFLLGILAPATSEGRVLSEILK